MNICVPTTLKEWQAADEAAGPGFMLPTDVLVSIGDCAARLVGLPGDGLRLRDERGRERECGGEVECHDQWTLHRVMSWEIGMVGLEGSGHPQISVHVRSSPFI